jgi:hypothetical protein
MNPENLKKTIGNYFLEFLMLFLAVSLGFVAENYREQQVEAQNELHYMKSFLHDLHSDTLSLSNSLLFWKSGWLPWILCSGILKRILMLKKCLPPFLNI